MVELPEAWKTLLDVLISAPLAWQSLDQVAAALGGDIEVMIDLVCEMDVAGWISVWEGSDDEKGPSITLTPLAAERLDVVLVEVGSEELPRWLHPGDPVPISPPKAKNVCHNERAARLDAVPDPILEADCAFDRADQIEEQTTSLLESEERSDLKIAKLPWPTQFLGESLSPWPGPAESSGESCPACQGRSLLPHVYCLYCDRWGLDAVLTSLIAVTASNTPRAASCSNPCGESASIDPEAERRRLQREAKRDRKRRKAKRNEWRSAQKLGARICE